MQARSGERWLNNAKRTSANRVAGHLRFDVRASSHCAAARFAPKLRVLNHTGTARIKKGGEHFGEYDLLITTYGTLRNDAEEFKDARFDYVILYEAQAIKNAASESAKAARLLQAEHRLALSGTPVENHLGELWSLFEFLNPGMLGRPPHSSWLKGGTLRSKRRLSIEHTASAKPIKYSRIV